MNKKEILDKLNRWFHDENFVEDYVVKQADFFLDYVQARIKEWIKDNKKPSEDADLTYKSFLKTYNWNGVSSFVKMNLESVPVEEILTFLLENGAKDEEYLIPIIEGHAGRIYNLLKKHIKILLTDSQIESFYDDGTMDKYYPDLRMKYMMLSRLKEDCEYYLGNGNRYVGDLWATTEERHVAKMKELWNEIPEGKKPEWLTFEEILDYEKKMIA